MLHALAIALVLAAPAKPPALEVTDDAAVKKAKELFGAGQKLYKQARYAEAIAKFEEAYVVRPHPVIFFNVGRCHEQLGETAKALRSFRDYVRLAPDAKDRDAVNDAIANLERRLREKGLQQLLIFAEPSTARIVVDGKELGTSPSSVELVAGNHTLTVAAEGFEKVERSFAMVTTRATEMTITLRPLTKDTLASDAPKAAPTLNPEDGPPPPPPLVTTQASPKKGGKVWTYVAGGVAVAGLGAGIGMGVVASGKANELVKPANGQPHSQDEATQLRDAAVSMSTGANVAYAVAGAAAVTALILFFVEK
jgi:tetratricopeptide (TPR) repeat protein